MLSIARASFLLHQGENVRVDVQGQVDLTVAQDFLHDPEVLTLWTDPHLANRRQSQLHRG